MAGNIRSRNRQLVRYENFSGGLNTLVSATKIKDNQSPSCTNIEFVESGLPAKRRGTDLYGNSVDSQVLGMGSLYTTSSRLQVRVSGTTFYRYQSGTWSSVSGKTYTSGTQVNFVQCRGSIYSHDATNSMGKYDGTTLSSPSTGVTAGFGIDFKGKHVAAGNTTNTSRLYLASSKNADNFTGLSGTATAGGASTLTDSGKSYTTNELAGLSITITGGTGAGQTRTIASNTGTVITVSSAWTTVPDTTSTYAIEGGDTLDVAKDDGQKIVGLSKYDDKILVFKEASIYTVEFDSTGLPIVSLVTSDIGAVNHRSIDSVENDVWFLANDGIRSIGYVPNLPGVLRTLKVGDVVIDETGNINTQQYGRCAAIYSDNKYFLAFPQGSSSTNNRLLVFDARYGAYSVWTGLNINCFNEFIDTDNRLKLYYGADDSGQCYQMLVSNYSDGASTAISAEYYTKQFDFGAFDLNKRVEFIDVQFRAISGTVGIDVILDGSTTTFSSTLSSTFSASDGLGVNMLGELMIGEDNGSVANLVATDDVRRIRINKDARTVQIRVYSTAVDETFTMMSLAFSVKLRSVYNFPSTKVLR